MLATVHVDLNALFEPGRAEASGWRRMPAVAREAMVATSHSQATRAGLRALERGGNAVDAALAAAAMLTVCEPGDNGVGGDAFAIVWDGEQLHGINGSGRSPGRLDGREASEYGPTSVTVPGAVRLWADLAARFGTLGLDAALGAAADAAAGGVVCTPRVGDKWRGAERAPMPAPAVGETYAMPVTRWGGSQLTESCQAQGSSSRGLCRYQKEIGAGREAAKMAHRSAPAPFLFTSS